MAEPRRFRRVFEKTTNTSIATSTKETLFDTDFTGIIRQFVMWCDQNDATGNVYTPTLTITIDGDIVFTGTLQTIQEYFTGQINGIDTTNNKYAGQLLARVHLLSVADKTISLSMDLDTEVTNNVLIEYTSTDATNTTTMRAAIIYDKEI